MAEDQKPKVNGEPKARLEAVEGQPKKIAPPTCPSCRTENLRIQQNFVKFQNGLVAELFWCEHCGCVLSVRGLGVEPQGKIISAVTRPPKITL